MQLNMKTRDLFVTVCGSLAFLAVCTQQPDSYTLTGHIEGLPDGTHVQLVPVSHDISQPLADTVAVNGHFTFTGTADEPRAVLLMVKDAYGSRRLMLENADIEISGTVAATPIDQTTSYNLETLTISGSPLSARYDSLMSVRQYLDSLYEAKNRQYKDAPREVIEAADQRFFQTVDSLYYATVMSQKESFWAPLLMISFTNYFTEDMKPWYEALADEAKNSHYGQMVKEELYPAGMVGTAVPEFTVKDKDGKEMTLATLREGKKYVLIDFWASWCNPCRKEIPNLKNLYKQYGDKGFQIVSISIDKQKADWEKALKEEQLPWPNFLDDTSIASLYKVKFVPAMYLIDTDGVMVAENLRGEALAKKLAELFQ